MGKAESVISLAGNDDISLYCRLEPRDGTLLREGYGLPPLVVMMMVVMVLLFSLLLLLLLLLPAV